MTFQEEGDRLGLQRIQRESKRLQGTDKILAEPRRENNWSQANEFILVFGKLNEREARTAKAKVKPLRLQCWSSLYTAQK